MKRYFAILFCFANLTAFSQPQTTRLQQVEALLQSIYPPGEPGISIAILQHGQQPFYKSYGLAAMDTKQPITADANFNIGSLTKQFTAMAILQLEAAGKLKLDDKLSQYFPNMLSHVANTVTISDLLTHSSGITDHYNYVNTQNLPHVHDADVYDAVKNVYNMYFTPGSHFRYSNTGFCLLALIIEKASGLSYSDYLQKNIFAPAGMLRTTVWGEKANISNPVMGYDVDSATHAFTTSGAEGHPFFSTEGDGGIYTSINDYLKWFAALQNGKTFPAAVVNKAHSLHFIIDSAAKAGYGYGWFVDEHALPAKVYHSGSNGGYRSYSFTIPQTGYIVLVFSNRGDIALEKVVKKINAILLGDESSYKGVDEMVK